MADMSNIEQWPEKIRERYENYLRTSFFFKEPELRDSFQAALQGESALMKGPFPELGRGFNTGVSARELADECFQGDSKELLPALIDKPLYTHQERAIRTSHIEKRNVLVATGTASGKTESFLYPILFELYNQYRLGALDKPGVRAIILYPMNALANDQRERLGRICEDLERTKSRFNPKFGQYIGQTPNNKDDRRRGGAATERLPGELIYREEMQETPPHILLTNYSMLEYMLIRPYDSPLFDGDRGAWWKFIVLDEAHQYRGTRGMEVGMLIRRMKQRLRGSGREGPFSCIATSATISSDESDEDRNAVAEFAKELFGEEFSPSDIIFGEPQPTNRESPRRYHAFLRALEGAFLIYKDGKDEVVLNRKSADDDGAVPLEIALCSECGQHYYVGKERAGQLKEAVRDPSQPEFGVDYYVPKEDGSTSLCRRCGALSTSGLGCGCNASIRVEKCKSDPKDSDQLKQCETCEYTRGSIGDPVQEIVHGADGPNAVIATALHELSPDASKKVLAFADNRQDAAFFAWYVQNSYQELRDRNLILRAINSENVDIGGLSINDIRTRMLREWEKRNMFRESDTPESNSSHVLAAILREALTNKRRLSLSGVGLIRWFVKIPKDLQIPETMRQPPWSFTDNEAHCLIGYILDQMRSLRAMELSNIPGVPTWNDVCDWPQWAYSGVRSSRGVSLWGHLQSGVVKHFLGERLLSEYQGDKKHKTQKASELMQSLWERLRERDGEYGPDDDDRILLKAEGKNGAFHLNSRWLRVKSIDPGNPNEIWQCDVCAGISSYNVRNVCPRNHCPGNLKPIDVVRLEKNHYRILYQSARLPAEMRAEEHTAQISSDEARKKQSEFKKGNIHLLSCSTTFEVGVDLGDLDVVFLRNVPPEAFNYTQRVGRAGRRETPGLAITYCLRRPHDLYHYENPEERVIKGKVHPPNLRMTNEKIISEALSGNRPFRIL